MAQLVARAVRDCEVASSNLVAQTMSFSGLSAVVARTSGGREVASSILVAPTTQGGKIEKIYFLYLNDAEWKGFAKQKLTMS